jgi:L-galactose dehydrogenase
MNQRLLGQTDVMLSELAFGGAAVGQQYGPVSEGEVRDSLELAAESGINLIDTSAYYGLGRSEEIFGNVLTPELRKHFHIGTKAGRLDRDRFDFSAKGMRDCFEGSLRRLKCERVDILLAHDIEYADDLEQVFTETAEVLHRLKAEGKCRFVGMSGLPLSILKRAVEQCQLDVIISYCHFTLFDQSFINDLLPTCEAHGVGVLNASPLSMGLLTHAGPPPWHPASETIKTACREAAKYCERNGADLSEFALRYCLAEPRITSTITGTARRSELERNLKTIGQPVNAELLAALQVILEPIRNQTWPSGR